MGTYIYKESGATVTGAWCKGVLVEGKLIDKYGNAYAGAFSSDATSAKYVPNGSFSLASSATASVPAALPPPTWEVQHGAFVHFAAKDAEGAQAAYEHIKARYPVQLAAEAGNTRCELLGLTTPTPTPPYKALLPDDAARISFLELFTSAEDYAAHVASPALVESAKALMAFGATGTAADFTSLTGPMLTLEKPGFGSSTNHVIMICCQAKSKDAASQLVEVAKGEVAANMAEPLFVRGTVIPPSAEAPLKVRWTVQWASYAGVAAHKTFEHHKLAGPKMFPLIDMSWGGAIEYHEAYHFAK